MFKRILFSIALLLALTPSSHAVSSSAAAVRYLYSTGALNGTAYTPLVASTVKAVKGLTVLNSGAYHIGVAINLAGSASSGDVVQLVLPPSMSAPVYMPLVTGQGYRISIISLESAGQVYTGEFELNALYN